METFAEPRKLVDNPRYEAERRSALDSLSLTSIDTPIRKLIEGFAKLSFCFTLQSCYGHFIHAEQQNSHNIEPLPAHDVGTVTYRIAYVALCVQNSAKGRRLLAGLAEIPLVDSAYVQFGSPDWFWDRSVNSFAVQVEPSRFADRDQVDIDYEEALRVEKVRESFFVSLGNLIRSLQE
jgi:hypothetical protein